jgi:hypothetical protein
VRPRLDALESLTGDDLFWSHQDDGLALFASDDGLRIGRLPLHVREFVHVGERFCVRPLLPAVSEGQRFHVLALSRNDVRLHECSRLGIREIGEDEFVSPLAEADRDAQRTLQFHTGAPPIGAGRRRAAMFHGHGLHKDARAQETERLLRLVDGALDGVLGDGDAPLVLAGVAELVAAFRRVSDRPGVAAAVGIEGNVEHLQEHALHARALEAAIPALDAAQRRIVDRVREAAHTDRVSRGVRPVLAAATAGRVEVLLVHADEPVWGQPGEDGGAAQTVRHAERQAGDDDLLDLAVARAWRTGARVLAVAAGEIPDGGEAAALLRY